MPWWSQGQQGWQSLHLSCPKSSVLNHDLVVSSTGMVETFPFLLSWRSALCYTLVISRARRMKMLFFFNVLEILLLTIPCWSPGQVRWKHFHSSCHGNFIGSMESSHSCCPSSAALNHSLVDLLTGRMESFHPCPESLLSTMPWWTLGREGWTCFLPCFPLSFALNYAPGGFQDRKDGKASEQKYLVGHNECI